MQVANALKVSWQILLLAAALSCLGFACVAMGVVVVTSQVDAGSTEARPYKELKELEGDVEEAAVAVDADTTDPEGTRDTTAKYRAESSPSPRQPPVYYET